MSNLNLNIFNIIILMGIIQGILFGLVVLFNTKYSSKTNSYLAYTVFSLVFSNLQHWFIDSNLILDFPILSLVRIPCELLIMPMFYLFVINYLFQTKFKKTFFLFAPFFIGTIGQIIISICKNNYSNKLDFLILLKNYSIAEQLFSFLFSSLIIILILKKVRRHEIENKNFDYEKVQVKTNRLKNILFIGLLVCLFWIIEIYFMTKINGTSMFYPLWISISLIIYWLSYVGLFQSAIFTERKIIRLDLILDKGLIKKKVSTEFKIQSHDRIFTEFEDCIKNLYLNPNLSLDEVADNLEISNSYLSQIINNRNIRFNDYVNSIRVEKAKEMLNDESFKNYTITSIGLEAGFNSNASFYRAFKKHTNLSPTDFRDKK